MRSVWFWSLLSTSAALILGLFWLTEIPLGIPGEWTWPRFDATADFLANLLLSAVAAAAYLTFVAWGHRRLANSRCATAESIAWQIGLAGMGAAWIWTALGTGATGATIGRWPFVVYYPSSSGYFFKARYESPEVGPFLEEYASLMAEGDVLHVGTHPPGLFLFFHGLIAAVGEHPQFVRAVNFTQPRVVQKSFDDIERNSTSAVLRRNLQVPPLKAEDRAILWLAALIGFGLSAATVWPLYAFLRYDFDRPTCWLCAAAWPLVPALAVFLPKSDVAYAFGAMLSACLWRGAWRRSSRLWAISAAVVWTAGLLCSLAFLPVALWLALESLFESWPNLKSSARREVWRRLLRTVVPAAATSLGLLAALSVWGEIPLWKTFWLNFQNHSRFYAVYPRTYFAWLLVNPIELCCALGAPIAMTAVYGISQSIAPGSDSRLRRSARAAPPATLLVWMGLWLSGKNSGEAARLWVFLMPYFVCCCALPIQQLVLAADRRRIPRLALVWLAAQAVACLLTVQRINGFPIGG